MVGRPPQSVVLGFFSFSKFLMYKDLDPDNDEWPDWSPGHCKSKIVRALYQDGFTESASAIGDEDHLDEHLRPEDVHHVVDADSSQAVAIHDANNGRNLVIQGPPGTGKSQTITNIIAEASWRRYRKVLFVSEKMAALEVVKRTTRRAPSWRRACLELHSHKTAKKVVLDELKRTWELGKPNVGRSKGRLRCPYPCPYRFERIRRGGERPCRRYRSQSFRRIRRARANS